MVGTILSFDVLIISYYRENAIDKFGCNTSKIIKGH